MEASSGMYFTPRYFSMGKMDLYYATWSARSKLYRLDEETRQKIVSNTTKNRKAKKRIERAIKFINTINTEEIEQFMDFLTDMISKSDFDNLKNAEKILKRIETEAPSVWIQNFQTANKIILENLNEEEQYYICLRIIEEIWSSLVKFHDYLKIDIIKLHSKSPVENMKELIIVDGIVYSLLNYLSDIKKNYTTLTPNIDNLTKIYVDLSYLIIIILRIIAFKKGKIEISDLEGDIENLRKTVKDNKLLTKEYIGQIEGILEVL